MGRHFKNWQFGIFEIINLGAIGESFNLNFGFNQWRQFFVRESFRRCIKSLDPSWNQKPNQTKTKNGFLLPKRHHNIPSFASHYFFSCSK
jgi:hypothetical protein